MPQINLLKQKPSTIGISLPSLFVKLLAVALLAVLVYYGWLYFDIGKVNSQAVDVSQQILAEQNSSQANSEDRNQLLTRQQQLTTLRGLIGQHAYWSQIFPALANATLQKATYSSIKVNPDGTIELGVQVPTITDLDLFLQVFNLPEFNANFSNVRVNDYHNVQGSGGTTLVQFDLVMNYNAALLQYKPATAGGSTAVSQ